MPRRFLLALAMLLACSGRALAGMPEIIARVKPAIVAVGTWHATRSPAFAFRGTGFAVGDGSLVATNAHVLPGVLDPEGRETLTVLLPGNGESQRRTATAVAVDVDHDLALLRIGGAPLPALALGEEDAVQEGESYAFTGFPIGSALGFVPVTHRGMIAAVTPVALPGATAGQLNDRLIRRLRSGSFRVYQLDATAYPGNSGSPLYDPETGRVVGIINMVFIKGTKEAALSQPSGISFAVPVAFLRELLQQQR